ncbi:RNA-binding protein, partial [Candidatus Pacearchaeota archaeon]|nr:RNA-binding protein [Candidatus Pacearchaeota archaeon]
MTKRLFVGNLPFSLSKEDLQKEFSHYGKVEEAVIITNKFSGRSKGFGFVTLAHDAEAEKAIQEMNGKEVGGRPLVVNEAKPMTEDRPPRENRGGFRDSGGGGGGFRNSQGGGRGGFRDN